MNLLVEYRMVISTNLQMTLWFVIRVDYQTEFGLVSGRFEETGPFIFFPSLKAKFFRQTPDFVWI